MKVLLICPDPQLGVCSLSEELPLAALPLLGSSVLESWLVHFAGLGFRQIIVYANDRAVMIRRLVGDGARWGLEIEVVAVSGEQIDGQISDAASGGMTAGTAGADCIEVMDHLPLQSTANMFASYANWFGAVKDRLPHALTSDRVGMKEVRPGVFTGYQSRISPKATLIPPCSIGNQVVIGSSVVIGPEAVIEDKSVIKNGAHIVHSVIGPDTLVGRNTEIRDSLVSGQRLTNWKSGSSIRVEDVFLLGSLSARSPEPQLPRAHPIYTPVQQISPKHAHGMTYTPISQDNRVTI